MIETFLGTLAGLIIFCGLVFFLIWNVLAPRNICFTFVKESMAKIIVRGDKFEKVIIQWREHVLDPEWNVVDGHEKSSVWGGLCFYGFWPLLDVLSYGFKWTGVTEDGEKDPHPKEKIDFVLLRADVYWCQVENAEDYNLLPLNLELLLTIRIVNPYKALFNIQNWLETVINRMKPKVRDIITQKSFEDWIKKKENLGDEISNGAKDLLGEFRNIYGVDVVKIQIKEINPPPEQRTATLKKYLAEQDKKAIEVAADAEAERLKKVATGEKERIEIVYKAVQGFGDVGRLVRTLEAAEKSSLAASLTVQAIPGLSNILGGIFGKPVEDVTQTEIKQMKEIIEKIANKFGI